MASTKHGSCALCGRDAPLTFHHLIPRSLHSNKWFKKNFSRERMQEGVELCRDCHSAIHQAADEKELARHYNTLEALRAHPEIGRFVEWVSGRSTNRVSMQSWKARRSRR